MRTDNEEISIDIDGTGAGGGGALPVEKPEPRVEVRQPSFFALVYTATFSIAHIALFSLSCIALNWIDEKFGATMDGDVTPKGVKILEQFLTMLAIHSSGVTAAKLIDWTTSNFNSYMYENPYLKTKDFDLVTDLNSKDDAAKNRLKWHQKRFYTFYFVSIFILLLYFVVKTLAGVS